MERLLGERWILHILQTMQKRNGSSTENIYLLLSAGNMLLFFVNLMLQTIAPYPLVTAFICFIGAIIYYERRKFAQIIQTQQARIAELQEAANRNTV